MMKKFLLSLVVAAMAVACDRGKVPSVTTHVSEMSYPNQSPASPTADLIRQTGPIDDLGAPATVNSQPAVRLHDVVLLETRAYRDRARANRRPQLANATHRSESWRLGERRAITVMHSVFSHPYC